MSANSLTCDLIIPALNEAANIDALLDALTPLQSRGMAMPGRSPSIDVRATLRHIILADNGSTDSTAELAAARGAIVVHEPQRGYGAACLKALESIASQSDPPQIVAFLDADLSDDPAMLPALLAPIADGTADLVIGSRIKLAEPGALNLPQRFGNKLACVMMHLLTGRRYNDLGPFRAIRFSALGQLCMADCTWGWTVEMQMKAAMLEVPFAEVDVPYRRRRSGKSKISGTITGVFKAGTKIVWTILILWRRGSHPSPRQQRTYP